MKPGREDHNSQANGRTRQSIGHNWLDRIAALRAPVAMDRVFSHHRRDVGRDVFNDPGSRRAAGTNWPLALGAYRKRVILPTVDPCWGRPTMPRVSWLGTLGPGSSFVGRLCVN